MKTTKRLLLLAGTIMCAIATLAPSCNENAQSKKTLELKSEAFKHGHNIPKLYTCQGSDHSPPLNISGIPANTKSLALIMEDPDAVGQTFIHWVAWNIEPSTKDLKANIEANAPESLMNQGQNSSGKAGYKGPCPPSGVHRYFFKLYALDTKLNLPPSSTKDALLKAMEGHILQQTELLGKYQKE